MSGFAVIAFLARSYCLARLIDDKPIEEEILGFEIIGIRPIYEGWAKFLIASLRAKDGTLLQREVEDHGSAASVLPYNPERKVAILVRQFRTPVRMSGEADDILEAIAGIVEAEDSEQTAKREAREEAGLELGTLEPAGIHWTMPGISTERMALFLAPYRAAQRISDGGGLDHEHEEIAVVEISLDELARCADDGRLNDLKTFALVQTLRLRRPELFGR
jgi:nudix-type nucleoside diphosphatase (YffH/AdpP family)